VTVRKIAPWLAAIAVALPFSCCIGGCAAWQGWSVIHPNDPLPAGALADLHRKIKAEIAAGDPHGPDPLRDEAYRPAAIPLLLNGIATLLFTSGLALLSMAAWAFRRELPRWAVVVVATVSVITFMLTALCVLIFAFCEASRLFMT
jgi:hypothetical protein